MARRRMYVAFGALGILLAGAAGWFVFAGGAEATPTLEDEYRAEVAEYPNNYDPIELSEKYYDTLGPEKMLSVLEENEYCHVKAHNLGRLIYIRNDRDLMKALEIAGSRCTDGAFHGVLMQVLDDIGVDRDHVASSEFAAAAASFCDRAGVSDLVPRGSCVHGVGHVLMQLEENDTETALGLCDIFPEKADRYYCAGGVFMQREKTIGEEDARVSARYPCDVSDYPAACYRYKLRDVFAWNDWQEAAQVCLALPEGLERAGCFHGLGFGFYRAVDANTARLPTLCDSAYALDKRLCLEGVVGAIEQNLTDERAEAVCTAQPQPYTDWCVHALAVGNSGMNRDMDAYYVRKGD